MPESARPTPPASWCAIDFGTSNSAIAVPGAGGLGLVPLEPAHGERGRTMPTAVFYLAEGPDLVNLPRLFGRAAVQAYVDGTDGRLMRSMKSVLGSALMEQHTDIGAGRSVAFGDVIAGYLLHLKRAAEAYAGERAAAPERAGVSPSGAGSEASRAVMSIGRAAAPERAGVSPSGAGSEASRAVMSIGRAAAPERAGASPSGAGSESSRAVMPIDRVVLGRPVYFVDDDAERDAAAQAALEAAARAVGFREVAFQYEPIAAAFHYEEQATREETVIVADIGGGTSDFSVVRVGPGRRHRADRRDDILASHGVHVAGTDFDRHVELARILPVLGYGAYGPARAGRAPLEVPSRIYFDLATWHLINTCYRPQRLLEVASMRDDYADPRHHARLMTVLRERLGHALAGEAEEAKIAVAQGGEHEVDLFEVERGLKVSVTEAEAVEAIHHDLDRIVHAARETVLLAGLHVAEIDALYFTGGSTGLATLARRLAEAFPQARPVHGDRFASVATGLGLEAQRRFGPG